MASSAETILFEVSVQPDSGSKKAVQQIDDQVDSLEQSFADLQQRSQITGDQLRGATVAGAQQAEESMQSLSSSVSTTSNQLAFELVQASQDAQFGMAGVANQIPLIAEQFGRLKTETGSTTGALGELLSTFTGPTGLLAIGTLGLQALPSILQFFESMGGAADEAETKVKDLRSAAEQLITGFSQELPQFEITDLEAAERTVDRFEAAADAREQLIEDARRFQRAQGPARGRGIRPGEQRGRPEVPAGLEQRFGDIEDLDAFIDRQNEILKNERAVAQALDAQIEPRQRQLRLLEAIQETQGVRLVDEEEQEEFELPDTSFQAGEAGFVEPPNAPQVIAPEDLASTRTQLTLLEQLENELRIINEMPFLRGAEKAKQRVDQVTSAIREAQRAGREFSRDEINDLIEKLNLTEQEANQVRKALSGEGEQAAQGFNQELAQGIRLAAQLGTTLVNSFQEGEVEARQLIATILQSVGSAVALANPAAGAALSGFGSLLGSFDEGGYTGDVPLNEAAGIVHGREYVFSADATQGNVQALTELHELMRGGISLDRIYEMSGLPGYASGGYVSAMTQPVVSTSTSSAGGGSAEQVAQAAADRAARQTAERVAQAIENRPNIIRIGARGARDVVETGVEYQDQKSTRPND